MFWAWAHFTPLSKGKITDSPRIDAAMPTACVTCLNPVTPILCSHFGEPDKQEKKGKSREKSMPIQSQTGC
ncbi:hypothetical protein MASR1M12_37420 [Erysipelotrichia bacterium]